MCTIEAQGVAPAQIARIVDDVDALPLRGAVRRAEEDRALLALWASARLDPWERVRTAKLIEGRRRIDPWERVRTAMGIEGRQRSAACAIRARVWRCVQAGASARGRPVRGAVHPALVDAVGQVCRCGVKARCEGTV